jgi:hypothetical protein
MLRWLPGLSVLIILAPALAAEQTRLAQSTPTAAINADPIIPAAIPHSPTSLDPGDPPKSPEPTARPRSKGRDLVRPRPREQRNVGPKNAGPRQSGPAHGGQRIALDPGVLKSDPPPYSMHRRQVVLVDDGSCQKGMIKRVAMTRFGRTSYCAPPR